MLIANCQSPWMGLNMAAITKRIYVIKCVMDEMTIYSKMKPNLEEEIWDLLAYSNSEWAGDVKNRISVTGFMSY